MANDTRPGLHIFRHTRMGDALNAPSSKKLRDATCQRHLQVCVHNHDYCTDRDNCSIQVAPYTTATKLCSIKWPKSATGVVWRNEKLLTRETTVHERVCSCGATLCGGQNHHRLSWLQQRETQRDRLYNPRAMNPSFVNAINSKLCTSNYSKPSQIVLAIFGQSVKQHPLRKAVPFTSSTNRWASAFIREKSGAARDFISPRTSPRTHPKWGNATRSK